MLRRMFSPLLGIAIACWAGLVVAQSSDPAAANREVIGSGQKVDVQTSANATIDVGGAGAGNTNVTGGNLRGNLGASIPQSGATPGPTAPSTGLPSYSFETPNFGPNVDGRRPVAQGRMATPEEMRVAEELILPRFRRSRDSLASSRSMSQEKDAWRYRFVNGRWWYRKPNNTWAFWNGNQWLDRAAR